MKVDRQAMESALLVNGNVLGFGGERLASYVSEVYDPVAATWTMTKGFGISPNIGTLTVLQSGLALVAAGANEYSLTGSSSLYNPTTNCMVARPRTRQPT